MDKDELLELLLSEDKELRKLGISLLINNFNLPEKLYYIFNKKQLNKMIDEIKKDNTDDNKIFLFDFIN